MTRKTDMDLTDWVTSLSRSARVLLIGGSVATRRILEKFGLEVLCGPQCEGAFDLILTDQPGIVTRLRHSYPETPIALMSSDPFNTGTVTHTQAPTNAQELETLLKMFKLRYQPLISSEELQQQRAVEA